MLTHDDLSDRQRYLNARNTLRTLVDLGAIPVINENDTVVTDEIRFGDNDTLAALVANLVEADLLVILTDRDGMFDADPRKPEGVHQGPVTRKNFAYFCKHKHIAAATQPHHAKGMIKKYGTYRRSRPAEGKAY